MLLALSGCSSSGGADAGSEPARGVVGLAMPTKDQQRWMGDGDNMVKQFSLLGYEPDLQYADDDAATQAAQIDAMIDRGARALVIGAVDGTKLTSVLSRAAVAGIPVVSYDRLIRGSADVSYYATFDNYKVGVQQATYIVEALGLAKGGAVRRIELFAGSPDDNNATFFWNGAMSVLRPYLRSGLLTVPSGQDTFAAAATPGWVSADAGKRMQQLLRGPDAGAPLDAVLAPNDGIARAVLEALESAGYGQGGQRRPVVTGQDAELDSVRSIAAGGQALTVYKDTRELAKVAVQMTDALLKDRAPMVNDTEQYDNGVKTVPTFLLQPIAVDRRNLQRVLVDGGYYTAEQVG
ncbi:sugar ABC transporter substrate-binding protein [Motilibacter sp. K478]|nr:sugar ABC transporter substrate-binding protein [Motilibacter aurantiacus]